MFSLAVTIEKKSFVTALSIIAARFNEKSTKFLKKIVKIVLTKEF